MWEGLKTGGGGSGESVIFNMATVAEPALKTLHALNCDTALQSEGRFGRAENPSGKNELALQPVVRVERFLGDAIESFTAEIFCRALKRWLSGLTEQT